MHIVLQNFYTTWVRGVACQKQRLGPKLEGRIQKVWDPLRISATVEASNLNLESTTPLPIMMIMQLYSTCHQKLTGTQISLLSGIKQTI